jgi:TonB family protein
MSERFRTTAQGRASLARRGIVSLGLLAVFFLTAFPAFPAEPEFSLANPAEAGVPGGSHVSLDRNGILDTREGLTLRLTADSGSVRIVPLERGAAPVVRYSVHIETDARGDAGKRLLERYSLSARSTPAGVEITGNLPPSGGAQFWVRFEVTVPVSYSLDVNTEAGDIETGDVGGTAALVTQGGNIRTGNIGVGRPRNVSWGRPTARLQTEGGHITVGDVSGDLTAFTAGGHIVTGKISGSASLTTGGGHIRSAGIGGRAELVTEGGNIAVGRAGSFVSVKTGGGQIDFGEVHGSVQAQTGGGGIRIMSVAGPMEVESSGGSICLTRVAGAVRAATTGGTITAWINPEAASSSREVHLAGPSQLASGDGDIVVFLPRNLAANIDATIENGGERRIEFDPTLPLQIQKSAEGFVHAWATLNGGGTPLKLRTTGGKIRLRFLDSETSLRESLIREQMERLRREISPDFTLPVPLVPVAAHDMPAPPAQPQPLKAPEPPANWTGSWLDILELKLLGGIREDADEFLNRITYAPRPGYPEIARRAGIQGLVRLQVVLNKDGVVEVQKILEGEPSLADAAIAAVKQWRGTPVWLDGSKVNVISTVTFNFKLTPRDGEN